MSDAPAAAAAAAAPAAPAKSKLLIIIACSVLAVGTGAGVFFMTSKTGSDEKAHGEQASKGNETKAPAQYVKFDPPFVVNFENKGIMRFLQVSCEVMTRDPHTVELIKKHDPKLRNDLLMLLGGQTYETISTREGKEKLRGEALKTVAEVMAAEGGKAESVEQLYFTSFVMQ